MGPRRRSAALAGAAASQIVFANRLDDQEDIHSGCQSQGPRPIGEIAAEIAGDLPLARQIERLHRLGPRVLIELVAEIGARRPDVWPQIAALVETYAGIDPMALRLAGGDRLILRQLIAIEGGRR